MLRETQIKEIPQVKVHGRTTKCLEPLTLFWTASGFECNVTGSEFWVELEVTYDVYEPWFSYKVAVMGCAVNGPGEAKEADIGIAGGLGEGLLIRKGEIVKKVPEDMLLETLRQELLNWDKNAESMEY